MELSTWARLLRRFVACLSPATSPTPTWLVLQSVDHASHRLLGLISWQPNAATQVDLSELNDLLQHAYQAFAVGHYELAAELSDPIRESIGSVWGPTDDSD